MICFIYFMCSTNGNTKTDVNTHFHSKQISVKTWNPAVNDKNIYLILEVQFLIRERKSGILIFNYVVESWLDLNRYSWVFFSQGKVIMHGKFIAVVYTLRTY